ncbi:MAG TPA: tryptophan synthase subunit alpha [Pyrinomonadaceae bacterium]|jgi:tryptophan synthase alpha chain|nr:tryptophan synthase subunit alpha [Pyrinomonadaceae bacterium]
MAGDRLKNLFGNGKVFSVFVTAGFPNLEDTVPICEALAESGVGLIELGIPFSDSIADGPTIQAANERALANGASLSWTLDTLREIRSRINIPVLLMGSLNPILQYGVERFCEDAKNAGADGVILPDLPPEFYLQNYRDFFAGSGLSNIFLITSNTPDERIRMIDAASDSFIYAVSMTGVTGNGLQLDKGRQAYLKHLNTLELSSPIVVGFGIEKREQFEEVSSYAAGAIVGSAFLRAIENADDVRSATKDFVKKFIEIGE